jgi:Asp-tRNA(Asn)/Glu-tRNA(Gln) amidotransferase A subunit family amidase
MDITKLKIRDLRKLLDSKEISSPELTQIYIDRIKNMTESLKAILPSPKKAL